MEILRKDIKKINLESYFSNSIFCIVVLDNYLFLITYVFNIYFILIIYEIILIISSKPLNFYHEAICNCYLNGKTIEEYFD